MRTWPYGSALKSNNPSSAKHVLEQTSGVLLGNSKYACTGPLHPSQELRPKDFLASHHPTLRLPINLPFFFCLRGSSPQAITRTLVSSLPAGKLLKDEQTDADTKDRDSYIEEQRQRNKTIIWIISISFFIIIAIMIAVFAWLGSHNWFKNGND